MDVPEIRFAPCGDLSIAYQRFGAGPELVAVPPFAQNIEVMWEDGCFRHILQRLAAFATFTHFDKRGTGLSDRSIGVPGIEERMDDFRAVMDHAGIERASLLAASEGGPMAILFAATYPERVERLVLYGTFATRASRLDPSAPSTRDASVEFANRLAAGWGTPDSITVQAFCPSMLGDAAYARWIQRYERACLTRGSVRDLLLLNIDIDVREALPLVQAPTLVLHRRGDLIVPIACAEHLAASIARARLVVLEGSDHVPWTGDVDALVDEIEKEITGGAPAAPPTNRVLASVLFTDIVGSTRRAGELGDARWRELLDAHDRRMRAELQRFEGREVKTLGDGFLASFDSPGRAVRAAMAMVSAARAVGCEIRAGVHTGEVEVRGDDVAGMAVHIGARIAALAGPSEVLVSRTVRDLVLGSELRFHERGAHRLAGVDGAWELLAVA